MRHILVMNTIVGLLVLTACAHKEGHRNPANDPNTRSCIFGGYTVLHGEIAYAGQTMECKDKGMVERECVNGILLLPNSDDGSSGANRGAYMCGYAKKRTDAEAKVLMDKASEPTDCMILSDLGHEMRIRLNESITAYKYKKAQNGGCISQVRTCGANKELSGTFPHTTCSMK